MRMVGIQVVSDLHLQTPPGYDLFTISPRAPHLALLGDTGNLRSFRTVFFVPGNHEAYNSTWPKAISVLRSFEDKVAPSERMTLMLGEFILMDKKKFRIGNFLVLGCSLFSRVPEERVSAVETSMNDFYLTGGGWNVAAHNATYSRDLQWLNAEVSRAQENRSVYTTVVLTHWSPSLDPRVCDPKHARSVITSGFATDLSREVCWMSEKVELWAWGHTHFNFDLPRPRQEGERPLRLLANQRGNYFQQAEGFDPEKVARLGCS